MKRWQLEVNDLWCVFLGQWPPVFLFILDEARQLRAVKRLKLGTRFQSFFCNCGLSSTLRRSSLTLRTTASGAPLRIVSACQPMDRRPGTVADASGRLGKSPSALAT